jgi:PST family polysaccharide transporter
VIRALVTIGALQFLAMLLMLVKTKVLAVTLGPSAVGTMSVVDKLMAVVSQTVSLSLPFAALRFLPAALRESPDAMDLLYRRMRLVVVALILPAMAVCLAVTLVDPARWGVALVPFRQVVLLAFAGLPVIAMVPFLTNAFAGGMHHARAMQMTIAHAAVLVVAAAVAAAGLGLEGFYGVYAGLGLLLVGVAAARVSPVPRAQRSPLAWRNAFRFPPAIVRFSVALLALTFAAPYAALYVQYTTLDRFGADASGLLQSAVGISLSVRAVLGAAHAVFLTPQVNREADPVARMAWANEFQRFTVLLFLVCIPPLLLFADVALRVLYSGQFVGAAPYVALFVATEVVTLLSGTYQALIVAGDRMVFHVVQNLLAQALLVATAAIALPRLGLMGAGLAALAAPLFLYASTLVFLRRRFGVRVSREAAWMAILTVVMLLAAGLVGARWVGLAPTTLAAKAAICLGLWVLSYLAVPIADRTRLQEAGGKVRAQAVTRWQRMTRAG